MGLDTTIMRAIQFDQFGDPKEILKIVEKPIPEPGKNEVVVRMLLSPINPSDFNMMQGTYHQALSRAIWNQGRSPFTVDPDGKKLGVTLPYTPGGDGVGIVETVGPGLLAKRLKGKRVAVIPSHTGNWQEYTLVSAKQALPISEKIPLEQAATFFINPVTAFILIKEILQVKKGQWVLQTAASSQLGRMVIKLSKLWGFKTLNIVRSQKSKDLLLDLGADAVINTENEDILTRVAEITHNRGVPHALDCVGGATGSAVIQTLGVNGHLVLFGTLGDAPIQFPSRDVMTPMSRVSGFFLPQWFLEQGILKKLRIIKAVEKLVLNGTLETEIGQTFTFEDHLAAIDNSVARGRTGKTIIRIGN